MTLIFELSISLQLSGALILLLWCFSKVSNNVLDMCFPGVVFAKRNENGELYIAKEMIRQKVKTIFLNVWAFIYIALGYLTSVFAENDMDQPWYKLILIVAMTALFLVIAYFASQYISAAWGKVDRILTEEEIEKYDIPSEATDDEILNLFVNP